MNVGGADWPPDRAAEEMRSWERQQEFLRRYGTPEGVLELEDSVRNAEAQLKGWNSANPTESEYLDAIDIWKRGWRPVFPEDVEAAKTAEGKMRALEQGLGIQYSDTEFIHHSVDVMKEIGYNGQQINTLQKLYEGRSLRNAHAGRQQDVNQIKSLMSRK